MTPLTGILGSGMSIDLVQCNKKRFPSDFMFQLMPKEVERLRSQFATLKTGGDEHSKYRPYAFTEQGVAMLSSVLHSERAIQVNIAIMRAFVQLREMIGSNIVCVEISIFDYSDRPLAVSLVSRHS